MEDFNNNESKPMKVNRNTYNWLNKLVETQSWENCFYYISRQGFGNDFSFTYNDNVYRLDYDSLRNSIHRGKTYKGFLLNALINGYTLDEPLYKVVDKKDLPLLRLHNNEVVITLEIVPYEQMLENTKKFYRLTEQQIKDYDERYWAFAVKIED